MESKLATLKLIIREAYTSTGKDRKPHSCKDKEKDSTSHIDPSPMGTMPRFFPMMPGVFFENRPRGSNCSCG